MMVEETFYRPEEIRREPRTLPSATYNLARILLGHASHDVIFVPIRTMQFLAILDHEEFIFVDRENRPSIDIAWQRFRIHERTAIDEPIGYEAVYYSSSGPETMRRLQGEFLKSLLALQGRNPVRATARIIPLRPGKSA